MKLSLKSALTPKGRLKNRIGGRINRRDGLAEEIKIFNSSETLRIMTPPSE